MNFNLSHATELLRRSVGRPDAVFRDGQAEAIEHVVAGRGRLLVVQKTGWGKSSVYFIATKLLREQGAGITLLVSPLLALMRNQIASAQRMGVHAVTINSANENELQARNDVLSGKADVLIISPERFANESFKSDVLAPISSRVSLLVVDEAHCISDWGHDFRPHYRLIERTLANLPRNTRVLATTATANQRVINDLTKVLGPNLSISRGDLNRPSLLLQTIRLDTQLERMAWLADNLPRMSGSGIIYALTVNDADRIADWLRSRKIPAASYNGTMKSAEREGLERALLDNRIKVLVSTSALGMGFDKPDLGFVVHFQTPGSAVAYYQQVGRAGRAVPKAYGVLLSGAEEDRVNDFFIESAFPSREEVNQILSALSATPNGLSLNGVLGKVNLKPGRVKSALTMLTLESPAPLVKDGVVYRRTPASLSEEFWQRAERLTVLRREEKEQMRRYVELTDGHMEFLIQALDGAPVQSTAPMLSPLPKNCSPAMIDAAKTFLRSSRNRILKPRAKIPAGALQQWRHGVTLETNLRAREGRALADWRDGGYGDLVQTGKYVEQRFSDELVEACAVMLREWNPQPRPTWVTCIPSLRRPTLVPDFAARLAARLGLGFVSALKMNALRGEQKSCQNDVWQLRNLDGALILSGAKFPAGPVLLIDDMVDSRWTFTIAAMLLGRAGCPAVFPLALVRTGKGDDE